MLLSPEGERELVVRRQTGLGCRVDVVGAWFTALSEVIGDPAGYAMFVVDQASDGVAG